MSKEQRTLMARLAIVATLVLSAVASWTVQGAMNQSPGTEIRAR